MHYFFTVTETRIPFGALCEALNSFTLESDYENWWNSESGDTNFLSQLKVSQLYIRCCGVPLQTHCTLTANLLLESLLFFFCAPSPKLIKFLLKLTYTTPLDLEPLPQVFSRLCQHCNCKLQASFLLSKNPVLRFLCHLSACMLSYSSL